MNKEVIPIPLETEHYEEENSVECFEKRLFSH